MEPDALRTALNETNDWLARLAQLQHDQNMLIARLLRKVGLDAEGARPVPAFDRLARVGQRLNHD